MKRKNKKAFTLIELLVVIAIIGILATIAVVALQNARAKARDARRVADVKQTQTALELFFNDVQRYPTANEFNSGSIFSTSTNGTTTYMVKIPSAPTPNDNSCATVDNNYVYSSNDGATYSLKFCLGGPTGSLAAGINSATPSGISYVGTSTLASNVCSCDNAALPCCNLCHPTLAVCQGGAHCARNANCPSGQICASGTCAPFTFLPDQISGLDVWLDANDASTIYTDSNCTALASSNNPVGCWKDKSTNNNNATQVATDRPTYLANIINNKPILRFNGGYMVFANEMTNIRTVFFVVKHRTGSQDWAPLLGHPLSYDFGGGGGGSLWSGIASSYVLNGQAHVNGVLSMPASSMLKPTTYSIISLITTGNTTAKYITNDRNVGPSRNWDGDYAEIIIYNMALSDTDRQNVENYLNLKYAIY